MFSGQEIVSQEECKIVLASFYEGVECFDETTKVLRLKLKDWQYAVYKGNTLYTPNFDIYPVVVDTIGPYTNVTLPTNVTGLQVTMHAGSFKRVRIMPLKYVRKCNSYKPKQPGQESNPYMTKNCKNSNSVSLEVQGAIDGVFKNEIWVVGYNSHYNPNSVLKIRFLDEDKDQVSIGVPKFERITRTVIEYEYIGGIIVEREVPKVAVKITVEVPATYMETSYGMDNFNTYELMPCDPIVYEACAYDTDKTAVRINPIYDFKPKPDSMLIIDSDDLRVMEFYIADKDGNKVNYLENLDAKTALFEEGYQLVQLYPFRENYTFEDCSFSNIPPEYPDNTEVDVIIVPDDHEAIPIDAIKDFKETHKVVLSIKTNDLNRWFKEHTITTETGKQLTPEDLLLDYINTGKTIDLEAYLKDYVEGCMSNVSELGQQMLSLLLGITEECPPADFDAAAYADIINEYYNPNTYSLNKRLTLNLHCAKKVYAYLLDPLAVINKFISSGIAGVKALYGQNGLYLLRDLFGIIQDTQSLTAEEIACILNERKRIIDLFDPFGSAFEYTFELMDGGCVYVDGVRKCVLNKPVAEDPRLVYSDEHADFVLTCDSYHGPEGMVCEQLEHNKIKIYCGAPAGYICTPSGLKKEHETVSACDQLGLGALSLGSYPTLAFVNEPIIPSAIVDNSPYIYFRGLQMYLKIRSKSGLVYTVATGDISISFPDINILDNATGEKKYVEPMAFFYLQYLKIPFEFIKWYGVDQEIWWSGKAPSHISYAAGYDFKIETSYLMGVVKEWGVNWNWSFTCAWESAVLTRYSKVKSRIITLDNLDDLNKAVPDDEAKLVYYSSNVPLNYAYPGIIHPDDIYGIFDDDFDLYVRTISYLTSAQAEAYAYYYGYYMEGQDQISP